MKKVFLAAPFKSLVNSKTMSMDEEKKNEIVNLIEFLEKKGYSVHNAHKREAWGQEFMSPEQCTKIDYDEIEKCDIFIAFPGIPASPGTHIEIGWASAFNKKIIFLLADDEEKYAYLIRGLHKVTDVTYIIYHSIEEYYDKLHTKLESMSFNNKIELRVQPLMPLGRGNKNLENICPTDIQYRKLVNTINTINARNPSIKIVWGDPVDHLIRFPEHTELPMYYISIRANGDIVTSPYLPLVVGNIRNHSIEEYWNGGLYELWKKKIPCYMAAFIKSVGDMGRITEKFPATFMDDIYIDMLEKDLDDLSLLPNN